MYRGGGQTDLVDLLALPGTDSNGDLVLSMMQRNAAQSDWVDDKIAEIQASVPEGEEKYRRNGPYAIQGTDLYQYTLMRSYVDDSGNSASDAVILILPGENATITTLPDYESASSGQPWANSKPSQVYIADGVTGIGNYAFAGNMNLQQVVFEDASSLTSVGERAFSGDNLAQFTNEGSIDGVLDLSNVTKMGEYAFHYCSRLTSVTLGGNITAVEGGVETAKKIPQYAFAATGLTGITIPEGTEHIGDNAFADCSLNEMSELVLPEGLQTVGSHAFYQNLASPNTTLQSLTIPSTVKTIGDSAFYNYQELATVTINASAKDGFIKPGASAFGNAAHNAYSTTGDITDAVGEVYKGVSMGADFVTPDAETTELFVNGDNCYLGDVSPLTYLRTEDPTCEAAGRHYYTMTIGTTETEVYREIPALGHNYQLAETVPASCERDSYDLYVCQNDEKHTERRNIGVDGKATGHEYQLINAENITMKTDVSTTLTWECQHENHDDARDTRKKTVDLTFEAATVTANTSQTLSDLTLPNVNGGTLSWANDVGTDQALTAGEYDYHVVFTPDSVTYAGYTGMAPVGGFAGEDLTVHVDVEKTKLDFSNVNFGNTRVFVNSDAEEGTPITVHKTGLPSDVNDEAPVYSNDGGYYGTTPPSPKSTWSGNVSVTFTYNPDKYEVDSEKKPGSNYTFDANTPGQVTITHAYVIVEQTMDELAAEPITPLTYNTKAQETIHMSGVPYSSTISWEWYEEGNSENHGSGSATSPSNANAIDIAAFTDAGTYVVEITVEKSGFTSKTLAPVTAIINKAAVTTPVGASGLQYTGGEQVGLAAPADDALYTYSEDSVTKGMNAGQYTAHAILNDPDNYAWSSGDDNRDGTVEISWSIAKRGVLETTLGGYADQTVPYKGSPYTAVEEPANATGFFKITYNDEGTLVGKIKNTDIEAFTITNAQRTNAGRYTVVATITDFANFYWITHPNVDSYDLGDWTIGQRQIVAPTVSAKEVTYDGKAYKADNISLIHSQASGNNLGSEGLVTLGTDHQYYTTNTAVNPMDTPPVNAGRYYLEADLDYDSTNYLLVGNSGRVQVVINKAPLTLTAPTAGLEVSYTGRAQTVPGPEVSGLVEKNDAYSLTYSYVYTPVGGEPGEPQTVSDSLELTDAGTYEITASVATDCQNYTSAHPVTYNFKINPAEQTVDLTSEDSSWNGEQKTIAKTLGDSPFTVKGTGKVDGATTDAKISYQSSDPSIASVDQETGLVTLHKATTEGKSITITVTAAASDNGNYDVGINSYTITVGKDAPTVTMSQEEINVNYTGNPIEDSQYQVASLSKGENGAVDPSGALIYTFYKDADCGEAMEEVPVDVGTYYMKASYAGDDNYGSAESQVVTVNINPATPAVDIKGYSSVYDGGFHDAATLNSVTGVGGSNLSYEVYYIKKTDAGEQPPAVDDGAWIQELKVKDVADSGDYWYKVVITENNVSNYSSLIGSVKVEITTATLTIERSLTTDKVYDSTESLVSGQLSLTGTVQGVKDEKFTVTATDGTGYATANAADDVEITVVYQLSGNADLRNYTVKITEEGTAQSISDSGTVTETADGTINRRPVDVRIAAQSKDYDGNTTVVLTGEIIIEEAGEGSGVVAGESITASFIPDAVGTADAADSFVQENQVTVAANQILLSAGDGNTNSANYEVRNVSNADVTIEPVAPTLTFIKANGDQITVPFDGEVLTEDDYGATAFGVPDGSDPSGAVSYAFYKSQEDAESQLNTINTPSAAGTYYVRGDYSPGEKDNYTAASAIMQVVISNSSLSVNISGYSQQYDGKSHDVAASINVKGVGNTEITDYTVYYAKKSGNFAEQAPAADNNDAWSTTLQVKNVADSGDYWYKVEAESYDTYIGGEAVSVSITAKPLTIEKTVIPRKNYDGTVNAAVEIEQQVETGIDGEIVTASLTSAQYNSANVDDANSIAIVYSLVAGDGTDLANYSLNGDAISGAAITETVTDVDETKVGIDPARVSVQILNQEKIYDGNSPTIVDPVRDIHWTTSDTIYNNDDLGISLTVVNSAADVGVYAITGAASNSNYDVTFSGKWDEKDDNKGEAGIYTVTLRPVEVSIGMAGGFYGDKPDLSNVVLDYEETSENRGLADGEMSIDEIILDTDATSASPVSSDQVSYKIFAVKDQKEVKLHTPTRFGNYDVTFTANGIYRVDPRPIAITVTDHSSIYGEAIDEGISAPIADTDYKVALSDSYTGKGSAAIVNNDDLGITLQINSDSVVNAGTYNISGSTQGDAASNYAITWEGNGDAIPEGGNYGKYTIEKAALTATFQNGDKIQNGVSIVYQTHYQNPLRIANSTTNEDVLEADLETLDVYYRIADDPESIIGEIADDGTVSLNGTGTARIEVTVTAQTDSNYKDSVTTWYDLVVITAGGGIQVTVTPVSDLTYNGEMQDLVTYQVIPESAEVTFTVTAQESRDQCEVGPDGIPQGLDAGTYTVNWTAKQSGYSDVKGSVNVTIDKAAPSNGFSQTAINATYEEGKIFDSTESTVLNVADNYSGEITYMSNDTQVARVTENDLSKIVLHGVGNAVISAHFAETENFREQTVSFTLTVTTADTAIQYTAKDYQVEYDGDAHGSQITVNHPTEYKILYSDDKGASYDLTQSPTITNVSDSPLVIYYRIQADGYTSAFGTQTVAITPKSIEDCTVGGIAESYTYIGDQITTPNATVADGSTMLTAGVDYEITYGSNSEVGNSPNDEGLKNGGGWVKITGTGNYTGEIMKYFEITSVDESYLSAGLDRYYGYYGDSSTDHANVTVMHGAHEVDESEIRLAVSYTDGITVVDDAIDNGYAIQNGLGITFGQAGIYTITVEVSGAHTGKFTLNYTLLPQDSSTGGLTATGPQNNVVTYDGENHAFVPQVSDGNGSDLTLDDYSLTYSYTPFTNKVSAVAEGTAYDPDSTDMSQAGLYLVTVTGKDNYIGTVSLPFLISQRDLSDPTITAAFSSDVLTYNGSAQTPGVSLTYQGKTVEGLRETEYYNNTNAGTAQAVSIATADNNNFTGMRIDEFTIARKDLSHESIGAIADPSSYPYTGNVVIPTVKVTDGERNTTLTMGAEYTVDSTATQPGTAKAMITGVGNYQGTLELEFTITSSGPDPVDTLKLTVTPSEWIYGDNVDKKLSVTYDGVEMNADQYDLTITEAIRGEIYQGNDKAAALAELSDPGTYTITAQGTGVYEDSNDTTTVTIHKIKPTVSVTADPTSLSGSGTVTLALSGTNLPAGTDLAQLLSVNTINGTELDLSKLNWTEENGVWTTSFDAANANETYTFTLQLKGNEYYESASSTEKVVTARRSNGVDEWLNVTDHIRYLNGYGNGLFGPDDNMSRAQVAQMFYNLLLNKDIPVTVSFTDVSEGAWYVEAVNALASLGIVEGIGDNQFAPDKAITRAEFTIMAMRFAYLPEAGTNPYNDLIVGSWYYDYVVGSAQYGWTNGYADGSFRPDNTITRAEVTTITNRMLSRSADKAFVDNHAEEMMQFTDLNKSHWAYYDIMEATNAHDYEKENDIEVWTGLR